MPKIKALDSLFATERASGKKRGERSSTRQIAFYGGNFTGLPRDLQRRYLDWAAEKVAGGEVDSIRFSTRPDALDEEELTFLEGYPVRTIEIGVQSLDDGVLKRAWRGHTAKESAQAVERVARKGWEVGVQLMPGLPGETREGFLAGVAQVCGWEVAFVRLYPAVILRGTKMAEEFLEGRYRPLRVADAVAWCADACELFEARGIEVIRMGLPASKELEKAIVAGPYHPAFGFLVQSVRFHRALVGKLSRLSRKQGAAVEIRLSPRDLPLLKGHRGEAWRRLSTLYDRIFYSLDPTFGKERVEIAIHEKAILL